MGAWKHAYVLIVSRGKMKVVCTSCGKASGRVTEKSEIETWMRKHSGIKEKIPKAWDLGDE